MKKLVLCMLLACDEGVPRTLGLGEPIRVHGGQFIAGDLPAKSADVPTITNVTLTNPIVLYGEANKGFFGRASKEAQSVGVRVDGMGSGFWIVPMGPLDNQFPGEQTWQTTSDFDPVAMAASPGNHVLRYVAIDANGKAGPANDVPVCFDPKIPDNGSLCDPSRSPPAAVLTLTFDADADVDLVVVGPDHTTDPKHPTTIPPDAGVLDPASGLLDRDSLAACVKDGRRQEDLVWGQLPAGITFDVYARLFDACGNAGVSYDVTLYTFAGTTPVATNHAAKGVFTSYDVSGATNGTYLFSFQL